MALKKSDLYSSLWASCDELRGGMDASQYKDYVLFMLFIKYVSDKYGDSDDFAPPVTIPNGASFKDYVGSAKRVAEQLERVGGQVVRGLGVAGTSMYRSYLTAARAVAQGLTENSQVSVSNLSSKDINNVLKNLTLTLAPEAEIDDELVLLNKSLASEAQLGEAGFAIAGKGSNSVLRDADRLAQTYGGNPADWSKMTSSSYKAADGSGLQTHWYQNDAINSGKVEVKSIPYRGSI